MTDTGLCLEKTWCKVSDLANAERRPFRDYAHQDVLAQILIQFTFPDAFTVYEGYELLYNRLKGIAIAGRG